MNGLREWWRRWWLRPIPAGVAHAALVASGRIPLIRPLVCPKGHIMRRVSQVEAIRIGNKKLIRCHRCFLPMRPAVADVDHPVARAAAYYGDGEQP